METLTEEIRRFLRIESGYGSGSGSGYGYGSGSGSGSGSGYGNGSGDGSGSGSGSGSGYGSGSGSGYGYGSGSGSLISINGNRVYYIDDTPTVIYQVRDGFARGAMVKNDLPLAPCWIARCGNSFAHGETIRQAYKDALEKELEDMPEEERIDRFIAAHPDPDAEYDDLFQWHHILTGSCEMGRRKWCDEHGLQPTDSITVRRFLTDTARDYGGGIIRQVAERMNVTT